MKSSSQGVARHLKDTASVSSLIPTNDYGQVSIDLDDEENQEDADLLNKRKYSKAGALSQKVFGDFAFRTSTNLFSLGITNREPERLYDGTYDQKTGKKLNH